MKGKPAKCYIWSIAVYGADIWTVRAVGQKCGAGEDYVRNEVLLTVKEQRNILHEISKQKANWIGHILCRNCLLQQVSEGKVKGGI
jgi:hypothetical protein